MYWINLLLIWPQRESEWLHIFLYFILMKIESATPIGQE